MPAPARRWRWVFWSMSQTLQRQQPFSRSRAALGTNPRLRGERGSNVVPRPVNQTPDETFASLFNTNIYKT
jgi:hypothetical protein